jgi:hypothetical protein
VGVCVDDNPLPSARRLAMRTLMPFRTHRDSYFHAHPLHGTFSLIASFVLAGLVVLMLVLSAR